MAKLTLTDITNILTSATTINNNNTLIEQAIENTLSRDGTTPNQMTDNLDMNSQRIINLADPVGSQDAVTKTWAETNLNGGIVNSVFGRTGDVVAVASDYDANLIDVTLSPSNYTAATADVEAHLTGIDTALSNFVTSPLPYDMVIPMVGGVLGTTVPLRVFIFEAGRSFTIPATGHLGHAVTGPTGSDTVFTVYVNTSSIGTVTFTTAGGNNQDQTFTVTQTSISPGDLIEIRLTTADSNDIIEDVSLTLLGNL